MRTGHIHRPVRIFYSMNLCGMKAGESAEVLRVDFPNEIKQRLRYLGVTEGVTITLLKVSPCKSTYLVQAPSAKIAIGREVAEGVSVCRK